jgi:hypothetical protein
MPLAAPVLRGNQQPRYLIKPQAVSSAAVETIELAASVGLKLDPWQQLCIDSGLGEDRFGELVAFLVAIMVQRQNGKGGITDALELAWLFLFGDPSIIHSAHRVDTATGAFRRVKRLIDGSDDLSRRVKRMNESSGEAFIELKNGQMCEFRTRGRDGGRGLSAGKLVLDEALEMELEVMADLLPVLLAIDGAQVWLTSTPPKLYGQYLTQLRKRALNGEAEGNTVWAEWSNPSGVDLSKPEVLAAVNPALGYRLTLAKLNVLLRELGPELFASECGGIWPEEENAGWAVISKDAWQAARVSVESQIVGRPAFGVRVSLNRSYAAIVAAGAREHGGKQIELTVNESDVVDFRPGTAWVVPRLKELEKHDPSVLIIDDKAIADEAENAGLVVHRATVSDVATGHALLFDGIAGHDLEGRDVHHLDQRELTDAVRAGGERKIGTSGKAWAAIDPAVEIVPIEAADLALFGHSTPRVHRPLVLAPFALWG